MSSQTYLIGNPLQDSALLIRGFSGPHDHKEEECRFLGQVACLTVPARGGAQLTLLLAATVSQEGVCIVNGSELKRFALPGDGSWKEVSMVLPDTLSAHPVLEIRFKQPHPLDAFVPRCAMMKALSVSEEAALPVPACAANSAVLPQYKHYFGDIHVHTDISPCSANLAGDFASNARFTREELGMDFIGFADHDSFISDSHWKKMISEMEGCCIPGRFETLFGYEWTSFQYGQMNVYSSSRELPIFRCTDDATSSPKRLWKALEAWGGQVFTAYHHTTRPGIAGTWESVHPKLMPVAEIYSGWGNSEYRGAPLQKPGRCVPGTTIRDALTKGFQLGFIGGGDMHHGIPGIRGITCVLADTLSKEALIDAILQRRCYATTGEKIKLSFSVNGYPMGSVIPFNPYTASLLYPLRINYQVQGTMPLGSIEIVTDGGYVVYSRTYEELGGQTEVSGTLELPDITKGIPSGDASLVSVSRYFYLRVSQPNNRIFRGIQFGEMGHTEMAWSSPIFLTPDFSGIE